MRLLALASILFLSLGLQQQHKKTQATQPPAQQEQRGTQDSPFVVKVLPTPKSAQDTGVEAQDREKKAVSDRNLVKATWVLAGIGILQFFVFGFQAFMLKRTVEGGVEQSKAMERHIGEAARSADNMGVIANTIKDGNKAIIRAYLTVQVGRGIYQQKRGPGQTDLKFEAKPMLLNTGMTPARRVRCRIASDVLPNPIPDDFQYPIPPEAKQGDGFLGAHQGAEMSSVLDRMVPDGDVTHIKEGFGMSFCVWGMVTYEDIFGKAHTTKFAQQLLWLPDGNVFGFFVPGQNDSD